MSFSPYSPYHSRRRANITEAVEAALEDIASGKVGRAATRRYVECDSQWLTHYSRALQVHNRGFDKGRIIVIHEEGWTA